MNPLLRRRCKFCKNNTIYIDYKNTDQLKKYMTNWSRIKPAQVTGVCSRHQRDLTKAIKRARYLALLPYVSR